MNVGTIGHVDHARLRLQPPLQWLVQRVEWRNLSYDESKAESQAIVVTKIMTIATSHVEYESDNRHYAHVDCPGHADYRKHDHWCGTDGRCNPFVLQLMAPPQSRAHSASRQVGVPRIVVFMNKCDLVDDEELWTWLKWKFVSF